MNEQQLTPNPNIRLVVNGGSTVLDSATIPVEWHLSDELISKNPKYVVICDHETTLDYLKEQRGTSGGNRYFCKVTDLVKYLQLFTSGKHHLIIMVFCGLNAEKDAQEYLKRNKDSAGWREMVWYTDIERKSSYEKETTFFEFEVPNELFAQKPQTGIGKFIWNWVNGWYKNKPIDECEYRKRKIFAFTIKPPIMLAGWIMSSFFGILYTLIGSFFLFFIGNRPANPWKNIKSALTMNADREFDLDLRYFQFRSSYWRLWKRDVEHSRYIPHLFVPFIFCIWAPIVGKILYSLIYNIINNPPSISLPSSSVLSGLLIGILIITLLSFVISRIIKYIYDPKYVMRRKTKKREKERKQEDEKELKEEKKAQLERQKEKEAKERVATFLKTNASFNSVPAKVDIQRVIPVVDRTTRFTIRFWNLKAKVCKPFARY